MLRKKWGGVRECWPTPAHCLRMPSDPDPYGCIPSEDVSAETLFVDHETGDLVTGDRGLVEAAGPPHVHAALPEGRPLMSVSNRLRNSQPKPLRPTKYGRCSSCGVARQPWIYKSGRRAGQAAFVCSRFFAKDSSKCFVSQLMTKQQLEAMPRRSRGTHASLAMSLRRAGKADWQRMGV